jgi:hypothetical protein
MRCFGCIRHCFRTDCMHAHISLHSAQAREPSCRLSHHSTAANRRPAGRTGGHSPGRPPYGQCGVAVHAIRAPAARPALVLQSLAFGAPPRRLPPRLQRARRAVHSVGNRRRRRRRRRLPGVGLGALLGALLGQVEDGVRLRLPACMVAV